jgi:hypothetical protein
MLSIATNCLQEVVSDSSYDIKKCLNRARKELASLCDSLIFLGSLVRVAFLSNACIVSDQTSEAGNVKYCPQLHVRSGLRFIIRHQEVLESCPQVAS